MWWLLLIILLALFFIYCLLPSYWARNHSNRVFRKGFQSKKEIALTFDDGPNPKYTPKLLDILREHKVKASFFIMGRQAKLYPRIIRQIEDEGHTIGCHSYYHNHAWLMPPWATIMDMNETYRILTQILEKSPSWYRPPWGTFNLLSIWAARRLNLDIAYWSIEAKDWAKDTTADYIYYRVVNEIEPGSIIVLHDNQGAPQAPKRTLEALPRIIETLHEQGYRFITLDEMKKGAYNA